MSENLCSYYLAKLVKKRIWFVTGNIHSMDNMVFERTVDKDEDILEFFVPSDQEKVFLEFMDSDPIKSCVVWIKKSRNRLAKS